MHDRACLAGRSSREDLEHGAHTSPRPSNPAPRRSLSLARHRQGEEAAAMEAARWAPDEQHNSQHASWRCPSKSHTWVAHLPVWHQVFAVCTLPARPWAAQLLSSISGCTNQQCGSCHG